MVASKKDSPHALRMSSPLLVTWELYVSSRVVFGVSPNRVSGETLRQPPDGLAMRSRFSPPAGICVVCDRLRHLRI